MDQTTTTCETTHELVMKPSSTDRAPPFPQVERLFPPPAYRWLGAVTCKVTHQGMNFEVSHLRGYCREPDLWSVYLDASES